MAKSKHEAVWDWLQSCPHIGDLFFSASRAEDGNTQMTPSERVKREFCDGTREMDYIVTLSRFMGYTADPNDERNLADQMDFDAIAAWIEEQVEAGNLPEFPGGFAVNDVEVLPSESGWFAAQDLSLVKYQMQFRIEYMQNKE